MITKINTNIPSQTNRKIINQLFCTRQWSFAHDDPHASINLKDNGLAVVTHDLDNSHTPNEILNVYAGIIFDMIQKNTVIKFKTIQRYYWNWYNPSSTGTCFHQDDVRDDRYSIIYNLHTNDGGTIFEINNQEKFEKSIESEAIIFPSKIRHMGVAPKENFHRFNLNIITQI